MFVLKYQAPLPRPSRAEGTALPALLTVVLVAMLVLQFILPDEDALVDPPRRTIMPRPSSDGVSIAIADPVLFSASLFAPSRGRGKMADKVAGKGPLDGATFVGVVRGQGFARAVLQEPGGGSASVALGSRYRGWRLVSLTNATAIFSRNGIRHIASINGRTIAEDPRFAQRPSNEQ
jgi:hypothetical protein